MAVAALVVSAVSAAASNRQQRRASSARKKESRLQHAQAQAENARNRRGALAAARRLRAQTIAQAEGQGVAGGSQVAGAAGSVLTQTASNVGFSRGIERIEGQRFGFLQQANRFDQRAAKAQAVGQVASSAFSAFGRATGKT